MRLRGPSLVLVAALLMAARSAAAQGADDRPSTPEAPEFPSAEVRGWQTGMLRPDRLQHMSFSYTAGAMVGLTSREPSAAVGTVLVLGVAKELWDGRRGHFDWLDLAADALGAAGAAATTVTLTR